MHFVVFENRVYKKKIRPLKVYTTIHIEKLILAQLFGQLFGAKLATHVVASVESGVAVAKVYSPAVLIRSIAHT